MGLEQTIDRIAPVDAARADDPREHLLVPGADARRYWAPCLGVALVAMSLFYVTLKDLVHEGAVRAPSPPAAVMPDYVEATGSAGLALLDAVTHSSVAPAMPVFQRTPPAKANVQAAVDPKAAPAVVEVNKCVLPEGEAIYSDGACPEGSRASRLRLPRDQHAGL